MLQEGLSKDMVADFKKECLAKLKSVADGKNNAQQADGKSNARDGGNGKKETHESSAADESNKEDKEQALDGQSPEISSEPKIDQLVKPADEASTSSKNNIKEARSNESEAAAAQVGGATKIQDRRIDPAPEPAADESNKNVKRGDAPEEQFDDFPPEQSGLDAETLAVLPPDAPPGSEAFDKVKVAHDGAGNARACFRSCPGEPGRMNFQVSQVTAANNLYAAFRITRACYAMFQEGLSKEIVADFKKECLAKLKSVADGKNNAQQSDGKSNAKEGSGGKKDTHESSAPDESNKDGKHKIDGKSLGRSTDPIDGKNSIKKDLGKEPEAVATQVDEATEGQDSLNASSKKRRKKRHGDSGHATKNEDEPEAGSKKKRRKHSGGDRHGEKRIQDATEVEASAEATESTGKVKKPKRRMITVDASQLSERTAVSACPPELEKQLLEALPPDAPEGHISFSRCRCYVDGRGGHETCSFQTMFPNLGRKLHLNISVSLCGGSKEAAMRITRLCYLKAETAATKEEIVQARADLYAICKQISSGEPVQVQNSAVHDAASKQDEPSNRHKEVSQEDDGEEDDYSESTSSSSSSSSAEEQPAVSEPVPQVATVNVPAVAQTLLLPRTGRACAKMLVRSGLRCWCHFAMQCPAKVLGS
eukprot:TRINITY_DN632_c0_g1_i5.p1 TRINITY_DN632_c0_g1~~TRINITY_DN632_c0_g1_i5.p1  ORF type:complete len:662 (-),score=142.06 TRINITY_DN632_c0_g1_i5:78-2027(-)